MGDGVPAHVENEFRSYLRCGMSSASLRRASGIPPLFFGEPDIPQIEYGISLEYSAGVAGASVKLSGNPTEGRRGVRGPGSGGRSVWDRRLLPLGRHGKGGCAARG